MQDDVLTIERLKRLFGKQMSEQGFDKTE